ncbi:hypothetical protein MHYP_G00295460 [Metynnis hypsauchen]
MSLGRIKYRITGAHGCIKWSVSHQEREWSTLSSRHMKMDPFSRNPQEHEPVDPEPPDEVMVPLEDMPLQRPSRSMASRHSNAHRLPRAVCIMTHLREET